MNRDHRYDEDFERDIVLARIKENEQLADLREEVDQFRRSQIEAEEKFFDEVSKEYPWIEEYTRDAKDLRIEESKDISNRRLGIDYRINDERAIEDDATAHREAMNGNSRYLERIDYWEKKLNFDNDFPNIDPYEPPYRADHFHLPGDPRPDFRQPDFEFEHELQPDSFTNHYRLKSYEFWRSMSDKYPWDLVDAELKANMVDPKLGFLPRRISIDNDIAYEAYSHYSDLEWRVVGDSRLEDRIHAEAELAYEDEMHHRAAELSEDLEIELFRDSPRNMYGDDLLIAEDNPFMPNRIDETAEFVFWDDPVSINQYRSELESLYELTDDDVSKIFEIDPSEYERYRDDDDRGR